jgi:CheY-like chemotaxis protein
VRLPIVQQLPAKAPASDAVATTDAVRQKVLVADDNHDAAESIAMILELAGHEVRVANSGQAALSLAQLFRPDTVVLDIGMPDLSGYQVAQRLRQEPWGKDIQLIALTGWGQDSDRRRALESGFDEHLSKPVEPESLEALINSRSSSQA